MITSNLLPASEHRAARSTITAYLDELPGQCRGVVRFFFSGWCFFRAVEV